MGNILLACFFQHIVCERSEVKLKYYYDRGNLHSLEKQCIGMKRLSGLHVRVFQVHDEAIIAVRGQDDVRADASVQSEQSVSKDAAANKDSNGHSEGDFIPGTKVNPTWNYFSRMKLKDIVVMLQPNSTEIFEGRVRKYDISRGGADTWPELLAEWTCLEAISEGGRRVTSSVLRSRFLILSILGHISGYFLRQEIFEERFGEIRILVYGLADSQDENGNNTETESAKGGMDFKVDRAEIFKLAQKCDEFVEQQSLANLDMQAIAYIFSDRMQVRPSASFRHFLQNGELLPRIVPNREVKLHIRQTGGPGHFVGRKILELDGITVIVTLYEMNNDTNSNELRIVLYETAHNQSAEFRVSPLERWAPLTFQL